MLCGRRLVLLAAVVVAVAGLSSSAAADTLAPEWSITAQAFGEAAPGETVTLDFTLEADDFTGEVTFSTMTLGSELSVAPVAPLDVAAGNSYTVPIEVTIAPGTVASEYPVLITVSDTTGFSPSMAGYVQVLPPNGGGTVSVLGSRSAVAGDTVTVRFLYTAATWIDDGTVTIRVPSGWSPPTQASLFADASIAISGNTITLTGVNLLAGGAAVFEYTGVAGGQPGPQTWAMSEANTAAGVPAPLAASPVIDVSAS